MSNRIQRITALGQAIWLDYISRDLLRKGTLRALINEGITGVTSNPSIFHKAITSGSEYDPQIRELVRAGRSTLEVYDALVLEDIREAADQLRPVFNETHGRDGYVSIEVSPHLAADTAGTIAEARRLYSSVGRPNVLIKVPATPEGLPAIQTLIGEGISVNVTLIFSVSMYEKVMDAYLAGLRHRQAEGRPLGQVASVASFFVSRVDTLVDKLLAERIAAGKTGLETLRGQAAVANAKIAYERFQHVFGAEQFAPLRRLGARVQRPLWASTSTKNPDYSSTKYVDPLIGPDTVNTVPMQTLDAIRQHATAARTIDVDVEEAYAVMEKLRLADIDMAAVTAELLDEGVRLFADSYDKLIADLDAKRRGLLGGAR